MKDRHLATLATSAIESITKVLTIVAADRQAAVVILFHGRIGGMIAIETCQRAHISFGIIAPEEALPGSSGEMTI